MVTHWRLGLVAVAFAALGAGQMAYAQNDVVTVKRAAELRDAPAEAARSLGPLAVQTPVTRLPARQGPWIQVRTAQGAIGWIHMFDVGTALPAQGGNSATGALRTVTGFFGGGSARPATTSGTSTIGIRGLGAEDIANSQPNLDAVAKAEAMRVDTSQARNFGTLAALTAQNVAPLPAPAPPAASATSSNRSPGGAPTPSSGGGER